MSQQRENCFTFFILKTFEAIFYFCEVPGLVCLCYMLVLYSHLCRNVLMQGCVCLMVGSYLALMSSVMILQSNCCNSSDILRSCFSSHFAILESSYPEVLVSNPTGSNFWKIVFCSSLCKDLSDNLTETSIVKNSIVSESMKERQFVFNVLLFNVMVGCDWLRSVTKRVS